jgi:hypothetical protein
MNCSEGTWKISNPSFINDNFDDFTRVDLLTLAGTFGIYNLK